VRNETASTTPTRAGEVPEFHDRVRTAYLDFAGRKILAFMETIHGLGAFALITFGVAITKAGVSRKVIEPLIKDQVYKAGIKLLPMISFMAVALGLVVIGQTVSLLSKVGAQNYAGTVMVTAVFRELGPLITAIVVLARVGAGNVIELGTARALGEVETLESLGIDPIHYLVVPRVIGMALSIFSLTIYLIIIALFSGYLFAFVQDVPLQPVEYFNQLAGALNWHDFVLLALKTSLFGMIIAVVTCYQGLAQPLSLDDVAGAATKAVTHSVISCVVLDALFIVLYLLL